MLFSFPIMAIVQAVSARIGCVSGLGIAHNLRRHYPGWVLRVAVILLLVANVVSLGADLGAMGAALGLLIDGPERLYTVLFGILWMTALNASVGNPVRLQLALRPAKSHRHVRAWAQGTSLISSSH